MTTLVRPIVAIGQTRVCSQNERNAKRKKGKGMDRRKGRMCYATMKVSNHDV